MNKALKLLAADQSMMGLLLRRGLRSMPFLWKGFGLRERLVLDLTPRTYYAYCAFRAADLASRLGYKEVSFVEFGVAGGRGLLVLEELKEVIERFIPIKVKIFGFDLGSGLPVPLDYRDMPYIWQHGFYEMDIPKLKSKLKYSELVLGPVSETVPKFIAERANGSAPIGMISFDLDYYSSTVDSFKLFSIPHEGILPRVMCYMDDVCGSNEMYSDYTGERLAISEFNEKGVPKITLCRDFGGFRIERWQEHVMIYHDFEHPLYTKFIGNESPQIPLS